MTKEIKKSFLILVLFQGLHSTEEYIGALWTVFPPAEYISGLLSDNLRTGFLIINLTLFIFGIWSWVYPVRNKYSFAGGIIWFWIIIELLNGIGHPLLAIYAHSYIPGVVTAPLLFITATYLLIQVRKA